jgi:hypothetical protein
MSWCQNNIPSTWGVSKPDSVFVSLQAIKIANAKMIELKYEKEINKHYLDVICADSIIIDGLCNNAEYSKVKHEQEIKYITKQRNKAIIIGSGSSLLLFILLMIAI